MYTQRLCNVHSYVNVSIYTSIYIYVCMYVYIYRESPDLLPYLFSVLGMKYVAPPRPR